MTITILDGGIGHLLKERNVKTRMADTDFASSFLVAAFANIDAPDAVRDLHREYIDSGADVITANNFAVTTWSLGRVREASSTLSSLTKLAAMIACKAADEGASQQPGWRVRVAGVLPPAGESYQVQPQISLDEAQPSLTEVPFHPPPDTPELVGRLPAEALWLQIATSLAPFVDLLICETMASATEAAYAAAVASASGRPFWVSFTIEDSEAGVLRSGESLADAVQRLAMLPGLEAVLMNCSSPEAITAALPKLRAATPAHIEVGAYANGFRQSTTDWLAANGASLSCVHEAFTGGTAGQCTNGEGAPGEDYAKGGIITPEAYVWHAEQWIAAGASIVGGCCGVGPDHIRALRAALRPVD